MGSAPTAQASPWCVCQAPIVMYHASGMDASACVPRMVPWRDWDEWYKVKALLFSPDPSLRCQGVQHVAVWRSRERVPHAVEATSQLVEVRLNDVGPAGCGVACPRRSEEELRLIYSTVVIRAINGLTGSEQKTAFAAPVSSLARTIGLPIWLVDIRHEAAHKQLPGIVVLRLAADFLMDYLWRRYWGPQAEHLAFLWSAFDQLISRFKATSETDASLWCNSPGARRSAALAPDASASGSSLLPHAAKKRRGETTQRAPASPAGSASSDRAAADIVSGGSSCSGSRSRSPPDTADSVANSASGPHGVNAAAASAAATSAIAAHEIAFSVTPTALSWALVSLMADGGMGAGGGDGSRVVGAREQGHLLPRSRDTYPTPESPGVDDHEVARKITCRWAPLLDIFHARWRGFGAALLVRLVEALLDNAVRAQEFAPSGDAGPAVRVSRGGGGGSRAGLKRQAAFIALWVRHLLSRRWHLRGGDARIIQALRKLAVDSGLSPAFCKKQEGSWREEERAWADGPAPPAVLRVAFFPVRELLGRCSRSLLTLAVRQTSAPADTSSRDDISPDETADCSGNSETSTAHWAKAGLDAVCHALDAALPGKETAGSHREDMVGGGRANLRCGRRASSCSRAGVPPPPEGLAADASTPSPGVGCGGKRSRRRYPPAEESGECEEVEGSGAVDAGVGLGEAPIAMMNLQALERLLGAEGPPDPCPGAVPLASVGLSKLKTDATSGGDDYDDAGGREEVCREVARGVEGGVLDEVSEDCGAWELVEGWTPCAIGTLPGWSGARLGTEL